MEKIMLTTKNKYDHMIIAVCKAILTVYEAIDGVTQGTPATPPQKAPQSRPTATSNGIPVCSVHGKPMRLSKYKEGQYYCGAKIDEETYCREKA